MMIATLGIPASPAPASSPQPGAAALPFGLVLDAALAPPAGTAAPAPAPTTPGAAVLPLATGLLPAQAPQQQLAAAETEQSPAASVDAPPPTLEPVPALDKNPEAAFASQESAPVQAPPAPTALAIKPPAGASSPAEPEPSAPVQTATPVEPEAKLPLPSESPAPAVAEEQASELEGGEPVEQPSLEQQMLPAQPAAAPAPERAPAPLPAVSENAAAEPPPEATAEPVKAASAEPGRPEPVQRSAEPQGFTAAAATDTPASQTAPGREQPTSLAPANASAPVRAAEPSLDRPILEHPAEPVVEAEPGRFGRELGVEIARRVAAGREEVTVRLNPQELGRIEVKMAFDEGGSLRAVVSAESSAALDMLRRDTGDLVRALGDAGVRSDSQSFRFDARGGEGGQQWARQQQGGGEQRHGHQQQHGRNAWAEAEAQPAPHNFRQLRASGRIDLMA